VSDTVSQHTFENSSNTDIVDALGVHLVDFKKKLTPRYAKVWFDIAMGYVAIVTTAIAVCWFEFVMPWHLTIFSIPIGAAFFGYWLAYLGLFFHEAAHFNIAAGRSRNDLLANLFLGIFFGQDIKAYRVTHFEHHRHHGTTMDTERSYFDPLNTKFLVESLTGIRAARVLLARHEQTSPEGRGTFGIMTLVGAAFNSVIVLFALINGFWWSALAWSAGLVCFLPFFTATRQVLEHRDSQASEMTDFTHVNHGAINRIFGDGPLASTLGGAGFNRHLLHHWQPQISYTRLKELEQFVMNTQLRPSLEASRSTYIQTFISLYGRQKV